MAKHNKPTVMVVVMAKPNVDNKKTYEPNWFVRFALETLVSGIVIPVAVTPITNLLRK